MTIVLLTILFYSSNPVRVFYINILEQITDFVPEYLYETREVYSWHLAIVVIDTYQLTRVSHWCCPCHSYTSNLKGCLSYVIAILLTDKSLLLP